jgi:ribosomal protein S18 acetylase RimI-like enzyme
MVNLATRFREARREDVPAIVALLADHPLGADRESVAEPVPAAYTVAFEAIEASPDNALIVGERDGEVVACLQLTIIPGLGRQGVLRAQIEAVRVAASARGAGLGEKLMRHAIERARERGCGLVQLTSDKERAAAHRFYERLGFVATHEGMKLVL